MLVVCGEIKEAYLDFPPALVIEILSPATASKDRLYKYELYQQQGIAFYLIVDTDKEMVELFQLEDGNMRSGSKAVTSTSTFLSMPVARPLFSFPRSGTEV